MGPVRQNPIQRTVRTAHLSVLLGVYTADRQAHSSVAGRTVTVPGTAV